MPLEHPHRWMPGSALTKRVPSANLASVPAYVRPPPNGENVLPSHDAMPFAGTPPAMVKPPLTTSWPVGSCSRPLTGPSVPAPKVDQVVPFHLARLLNGAALISVK